MTITRPAFLAVLAAVSACGSTLALSLAGCGAGQPRSDLEVPTSPTDVLRPIPSPELGQFGCNDPFVVCVNACTGRLVHPKVAPLVAEGQKVTVRIIGWGSCRPEHVVCTGDNVHSADGAFQPSSVSSPSDSGTSPTQQMAAEARSLPISASSAATQKLLTKVEGAAQGVSDAGPSAEQSALLEVAQEAFDEQDPLNVTRLLTLAATKAGPAESRDAMKRAAIGSTAAEPCAVPLADIAAMQARLNSFENDNGDLPVSLAQWKADVLSTLSSAKEAVNRYEDAAKQACQTPTVAAFHDARKRAADAQRALQRVEAAAVRAHQAAIYEEQGLQLAHFGDCVMTMPSGDTTIPQVVIDVKMTPQAITTPGALDGGGDAGPDDPTAVKEALVYVNVSHGRYYYDVGALTAFVPLGQRTIVTPQRPGLAGDQMIALNEQASQLTAIALNLYPFGHRRETYSFLQRMEPGCLGWAKDLVGFQVAFNPNLNAATSTLFAGLLLEPVAGLSLSGGVAVLQGDFLQTGYSVGMSAPSNRSDYVVQKLMLRGYFGFTIGFELFNTAARRLPASLQPTESNN